MKKETEDRRPCGEQRGEGYAPVWGKSRLIKGLGAAEWPASGGLDRSCERAAVRRPERFHSVGFESHFVGG